MKLLSHSKALVRFLATMALAAASFFVGAPLALFGYLALFGFTPNATLPQSFLLGVVCIFTACLIWTVTCFWLAWCDGRWKRFTLGQLMIAVTLATVYVGLFAMLAASG